MGKLINKRDLEIGNTFKFKMRDQGYLILKVEDIDDSFDASCEVIDHHYNEPAEDEFEANDRYMTGDYMLYFWDDRVELITE